MKRNATVAILALIMLLSSCAARSFEARLWEGLSYSKALHIQHVEAMKKAEQAGKVTPGTARWWLDFDTRYHEIHDSLSALGEQYLTVKITMKKFGTSSNKGRLAEIRAAIQAHQASLVVMLDEVNDILAALGVVIDQ